MCLERAVHFFIAFSIFSSYFSFSSFFSFSFFFSLSSSLPFSLSFSFPSLFPFLSHSLFLSFPLSFSLLRLFFFFEGTSCTVYFRDVRNDTTICNQLYLHWNKEIFSFFIHEFAHSDVCNFLVHSLAELSETSNK